MRSRKSSSPSTSICASFAAQFGSTPPELGRDLERGGHAVRMRRAGEAHHQQAGLARRLQLDRRRHRRDGAARRRRRTRGRCRRAAGRPACARRRAPAGRSGSSLAISTEAIQGLLCTRAAASASDSRTRFFPLSGASAWRIEAAETRPAGEPFVRRTSTVAQPEERRGEHPGDQPGGQRHQPDGGGERLQQLDAAGSCAGGAAACRGGGSRAPGPPAPGGTTEAVTVVPVIQPSPLRPGPWPAG